MKVLFGSTAIILDALNVRRYTLIVKFCNIVGLLSFRRIFPWVPEKRREVPLGGNQESSSEVMLIMMDLRS